VYEAVQTTASTAGTWVIVVVAVLGVIFLIAAPLVADLVQHRANDGNRREAVLGRPWIPAPRSQFPGEFPRQRPEDEAIAAEGAHRTAAGRHRRADAGTSTGTSTGGETPTRPDLPAQEAAGRHEMPAQRTGEADRAERSRAGTDGLDDDEDGRR
jgi:hypothetical protein